MWGGLSLPKPNGSAAYGRDNRRDFVDPEKNRLKIGAQVDDYGHRFPRDPAGKMWKNHRILRENTGNRWNMEAVVRPEIVRIFSGGFLSTSRAFRQKPSEYYFHKITELTRTDGVRAGSFDLRD